MCEVQAEDSMSWYVAGTRCLRIPEAVWYSRENSEEEAKTGSEGKEGRNVIISSAISLCDFRTNNRHIG